MNLNPIEKIIIDPNSPSSTDSLERDDVDSLMQALVPNSERRESIHSKGKEEEVITSSITHIEDIRKSVNHIKDINQTLEQLIRQYEVSMDTDQRLALQHKITATIQQGNSLAASSRFSIQTLKLAYNGTVRKNQSATTYNLFAQSYNTIAHSFIENITAYQKLQKRYKQLLEKNYALPSFLEEPQATPTTSLEEKQIVLGETVHHQLVEACIDSQMQNREIEMIHKSMQEIQQLFFDLALLVDEQSEMLDYVQLNIDTTNDRTDRTETELQNSVQRMKKIRKMKCCILITIVILFLIAVLSAILFAKSIAYCCFFR